MEGYSIYIGTASTLYCRRAKIITILKVPVTDRWRSLLLWYCFAVVAFSSPRLKFKYGSFLFSPWQYSAAFTATVGPDWPTTYYYCKRIQPLRHHVRQSAAW